MAKKVTTNTNATSFPNLVEDAFMAMVQTYKSFFFNSLCPAIPNSDGKISFTERNLTFNFCNSYLQNAGVRNGDKIFVWQELDITQAPDKRGHIDSVILDLREEVKSIVFIEAKRIANGGSEVNGVKVRKMEALKNDMDRLRHLDLPGLTTLSPKWNFPEDLRKTISKCYPNIYIMALVDYWKWNGRTNTIAAAGSAEFSNCTNRPFDHVGSINSIKGDYYLNYCLENLNSQLGKCCCSSQPKIR